MSTEIGHYFTIAKDLINSRWITLNDIHANVISEVELDSILM